MVLSLKILGVKFSASKVPRSEQSLSDMIEAAEFLVATGDSSNLNSRKLSKKSGYSLGAVVKRLGKVENVFLHAIAHGRSRNIKEISLLLESYGCDKTVFEHAKLTVDLAFELFPKVGASVIKYYECRAMGRTKTVADVHAYTEEIVPALRKVIDNDKTGTFRTVNDYELRYIARAIFIFLEQPYVIGDPMAGSQHHRDMASDLIASLLWKHPDIDVSRES